MKNVLVVEEPTVHPGVVETCLGMGTKEGDTSLEHYGHYNLGLQGLQTVLVWGLIISTEHSERDFPK